MERGGGVEDIEFPEELKKEPMEIPGGQLRKKWNFQVMKKKSCGISMGLGFQSWNFQEVSYKSSQKSISSPPRFLDFFLNSPTFLRNLL